MSEAEVNNQDNQDKAAANEATAALMAVAVPSNFSIHAPMECKGDVIGNWKFFACCWKIMKLPPGSTHNHLKSIYQPLDTFDPV